MARIKRYLITGSSGYIGTNMVNLANAETKFGLCDYNTSLPPAHKMPKEVLSHFDGIIHLAALSGIAACEARPYEAIIDNVMSAANIFKLANEIGIPVVFTSSQAAKEPHSSIYANMKWTCETLANYFNGPCSPIYVVRLANVYGGEQYLEKKGTCVKQFITKYNNGEPLEVHGNGMQVRDFVHVSDVCTAIMHLLNEKPNCNMPIDVGTGVGHSIVELANMFPRKQNQHFNYSDSRSAGAESNIADTSLLMELTGFKPERKLEDYIKEMI